MREGTEFQMLCGLWSRLRGLLFRQPDGKTVMLVPCADVHTFGMRHNIDVAFVDVQGVVMAVHQNVAPRRRLRHKGAVAVLERFSSSGKAWVCPGDRLEINKRSGQ